MNLFVICDCSEIIFTNSRRKSTLNAHNGIVTSIVINTGVWEENACCLSLREYCRSEPNEPVSKSKITSFSGYKQQMSFYFNTVNLFLGDCALVCTLVFVVANDNLQLVIGFNDGDVVGVDAVVRLAGSLHSGVALGDGFAVGESLGASATRVDELIIVALVSSILVEDLSPVTSNAAKATRNNLVEDTNLARLGKVLHPTGSSVAGDGMRVLGILVLPVAGAAERRRTVGATVPVQAMRHFVEDSSQIWSAFKDDVAAVVDEGSSAVIETGSGNGVAVPKLVE